MQSDEELPEPNPGDLAELIIRETMLRVWGSLPARVTAYYPPGDDAVGGGRQPARVDLLISIKRRIRIDNIEDMPEGYVLDDTIGEEETANVPRLIAIGDYPPILRAVVMRASAGDSTMRLRGAVAVGTSGAAHICARSLDRWATRTGQTDPVWTHAHEISDAMFFPEVREGPAEVDDPAAAGLWSDDATCGLTFDPGEDGTAALTAPKVDLGQNPTHHAARSEQVDANLTGLKNAIAAIPPPVGPEAIAAVEAIQAAFALWSTPTTKSEPIRIPAA